MIDNLQLKLIDFGLAKHHNHSHKCELDTQCGTVDFMAPEIIEGKNYDFSVDVWSIGVIAYVCLTGTVPFAGKDVKTK